MDIEKLYNQTIINSVEDEFDDSWEVGLQLEFRDDNEGLSMKEYFKFYWKTFCPMEMIPDDDIITFEDFLLSTI